MNQHHITKFALQLNHDLMQGHWDEDNIFGGLRFLASLFTSDFNDPSAFFGTNDGPTFEEALGILHTIVEENDLGNKDDIILAIVKRAQEINESMR